MRLAKPSKPARKCGACNHPERLAIGAMIIERVSERLIAKRFGIGQKTVNRHKAHIAPKIEKAARVEGESLLSLVTEARGAAREVLAVANRTLEQSADTLVSYGSSGPLDMKLKAVDRLRGLAELEHGSKVKVTTEPSDEEMRKRAVEYLEALGYEVRSR
jgi:hypothetical protein